jgi:hypothetical protein
MSTQDGEKSEQISEQNLARQVLRLLKNLSTQDGEKSEQISEQNVPRQVL